MEFGWSPEIDAFRDEVRAFIKEVRTPELEAELRDPETAGVRGGPALQRIRDQIEARGWMKMTWPEEYGGQGKSAWYQFVLSDEFTAAGIPYGRGTASMIAPAIQRFGTDEQKAKYLPPIWSGEMTLALGYSEPNAGTDLASLETLAVKDGDEWVINGQKLWTSAAHVATHVWLAARTDPSAPKHRGVSMFIVPLDAAGVSVRPIWTMGGVRTNETFYEDVRVPADALIGEPGRGWYILANALDFERVAIGDGGVLNKQFARLVHHLRTKRPEALADPVVRQRLAEADLDLEVMRALIMTNASIVARGDTPTMEASMSKVWTTELRYTLGSLGVDLLGRDGVLSRGSGGEEPLDGEFDVAYRASPFLRFGGGTNEVQRDIIARRGLGLPR
jgi:alkylation response protein AidB-like acyl-CoA dehydrogenase